MKEFIIRYWTSAAFGVLTTGLVLAFKIIMSVCKGMRALLRDRIVQAYNHYDEKEYCPIYARETIQDMYEQYHNLGGNGTITDLVSRLMDMPTEKKRKVN